MGIFSALFGRTGPGKYMAAKNALVSKYTFSTLDPPTQEKIDEDVLRQLIRGGIPAAQAAEFKTRLRETQYFGLAAFAMAELEIAPKLSGILFKNWWEHVSNPLVALTGAEKEIEMASAEIQRKHQVTMTISDEDR